MKLIASLALSACVAACDTGNQVGQTSLTSATVPAPSHDPNAPSGGAPPSNHQDDPTVTLQPLATENALGETPATTDIDDQTDMDTTAAVRKALLMDETLSAQAKNVSIATTEGIVSVNGVVRTLGEKTRIDSDARTAAGERRVVNRLTLEPLP